MRFSKKSWRKPTLKPCHRWRTSSTRILHQQSREIQGRRSVCCLVNSRGHKIASKQCLSPLRALINEINNFDLVDLNSRPSYQPNIETEDLLKNIDLLKCKVETQEWAISFLLKGNLSFFEKSSVCAPNLYNGVAGCPQSFSSLNNQSTPKSTDSSY